MSSGTEDSSSSSSTQNASVPILNLYHSALLWRSAQLLQEDPELAMHMQQSACDYFPQTEEIHDLTNSPVLGADHWVRICVHDTIQMFARYLIETNDQYDGTVNWIEKAIHLQSQAKVLLRKQVPTQKSEDSSRMDQMD